MRLDKHLAIKLRLQGKSYSEIRVELPGISKSTLSSWLSGVELSRKARNRLSDRVKGKSLEGLLKRNKLQTKLAHFRKNRIENSAKREIKFLSDDNLFFAGLALYWAEGYKRPIVRNGREVTYHPISLTNSDPKLVNLFLLFLEKVCDIKREQVKANLRIFKHLNEAIVLDFWVKNTGIPVGNFNKTYLGISKSSMGKRPFNRLPFGVIQIRISNTDLFHKIMGWITGLKEKV